MINTSDVRRGNFVVVKHSIEGTPVVVRISSILVNDFQVEFMGQIRVVSPEEVTGIELTDETLQLMGFISGYMGNSNLRYFEPLFLEKLEDGYYLTLSSGRVNRTPIVNLHQLQNIYHALTGDELPLNPYFELKQNDI